MLQRMVQFGLGITKRGLVLHLSKRHFMRKTGALEKLGKNEIKPEVLAREVVRNSALLPEILKGISSPKARVKFGCAKILSIVSENKPEILYPEFEFFVGLLDCGNNIIKWNAMDVLANLTKVDTKNRFESIFQRYYGFLEDEVMITAGHVVDNSGAIAGAKPHLTRRITAELLKVERIPRNQECKNILLGKAITAFGMFFDQIQNKDDVISFVKRQLSNTRNATKAKADRFLIKRREQEVT